MWILYAVPLSIPCCGTQLGITWLQYPKYYVPRKRSPLCVSPEVDDQQYRLLICLTVTYVPDHGRLRNRAGKALRDRAS